MVRRRRVPSSRMDPPRLAGLTLIRPDILFLPTSKLQNVMQLPPICRQIPLAFMITAMATIHLAGCGESTEDAFMRAAMRVRPKSADEKEGEKNPNVAPEQAVTATID